MRLTQLLYFKTVVETGSISRASKKLYVTAPAVSIGIGNLEKDLGIELFDRTSNRIMLTEQGRAYYESISKILDELSQATKNICGTETDVFGGGGNDILPASDYKDQTH